MTRRVKRAHYEDVPGDRDDHPTSSFRGCFPGTNYTEHLTEVLNERFNLP